jgi:hypothetical protein
LYEWSDTEYLDTVASNGTFLPAPDNVSVWSIGGVITGKGKLK